YFRPRAPALRLRTQASLSIMLIFRSSFTLGCSIVVKAAPCVKKSRTGSALAAENAPAGASANIAFRSSPIAPVSTSCDTPRAAHPSRALLAASLRRLHERPARYAPCRREWSGAAPDPPGPARQEHPATQAKPLAIASPLQESRSTQGA